jgi:hypothetical protein
VAVPLLAATPPTLACQTGICMGKESSNDFELRWRRSEHLRHKSTTWRSPLPMLRVNGRVAREQAFTGQPQNAEAAPVSLVVRRGIPPPKPIEVRVRERPNLVRCAIGLPGQIVFVRRSRLMFLHRMASFITSLYQLSPPHTAVASAVSRSTSWATAFTCGRPAGSAGLCL